MTFLVEPYDDDAEVRSDFYDDYDEFSDCDCDLCNPDFEEDEGENYDGDPLEREGLYDEFN